MIVWMETSCRSLTIPGALLAVRRSGVTVAVQSLEQSGHIRADRGRITILNRDALEEIAGSFYGVPEGELRRLMGEGRAPSNRPLRHVVAFDALITVHASRRAEWRNDAGELHWTPARPA